ncbi:DNA gyrase inhibitor YacG [Novosphingobium sp. B 225]|uniref:DNA gyrase inhibitor YacG n=1 Tax=Novosphingobium sp. B 225 TaxID=1961849 RepID=UPI003F9247ED
MGKRTGQAHRATAALGRKTRSCTGRCFRAGGATMTSSMRKCPICGKPRAAEHSPFCSTRCKDRDLVRWLDQGYAVPGAPVIDEEEGKA